MTLLISLNQRIDERQLKIDEFNEALEELDDGDSSSKNIYVFQDVGMRRIWNCKNYKKNPNNLIDLAKKKKSTYKFSK